MFETVEENKSWEWIRKSYLKVETEAFMFAAQNRH